MAKQRLLLVTHKVAPYLPADEQSLGKNFPHRIASRGYEVRTFMPKFGMVNERRNQLHEVIRLSGINIPINNNDHPLVVKVASLQPSRIQVYFIDNDDYFTKSEDDSDVLGSNRKDNEERTIYFAHATAETVKKLLWDPTIVYVSGWISALLPLYLKKKYSRESTYLKSKIIYSVLPGEIKEKDGSELLKKLIDEGISEETLEPYKGKKFSADLLHRIAIENSDAVIFHMPSPSKMLLEIAEKKGLPILIFDEKDENLQSVSDFFKSLTDEN